MKARALSPVFASLAFLVVLPFVAGPAQCAEVRLHAVLTGTPLVPATDSTASGEAKAVLQDDGTLKVDVVFAGVDSIVSGVTLHTGASNATGPAVVPLQAHEAPAGFVVDQTLKLDAGPATDMRAGNTYILVTTADRPSGALRGQLVPQPVRLPATP